MIVPFVLLDAAMSAVATRARIAHYRGRCMATVRRLDGFQTRWYLIDLDDVAARLAEAEDAARLGTVLDLDHRWPAESRQVDELDRRRPERFAGVVLAGDEVVAVSVPEPQAAPIAAGPGELSDDFREVLDVEDPARPGRRRGSKRASASEALARGVDFAVVDDSPPPAGDAPATFPAHPRLDAPRQLAAGEAFTLTVGLAVLRQAEVLGDRLDVPVEPDGRTFQLDLQVVADGFSAPSGWRHTLRGAVESFTAAEAKVPLVAPAKLADDFQLASLVVHFSHRGTPLGTAWRNVLVRAAGQAAVAPSELAPLATGDGGTDLGTAEPAAAPDLTVRIEKSPLDHSGGRFLLTWLSPHPIEAPDEPLVIDLGDDVKTFSKACVDQVEGSRGKGLADNVLRTICKLIADKVPDELWAALAAVAERLRAVGGGVPAVLLLTAESSVPWELAWMPEPLDRARPPLLGAQVALGRWILAKRPPQPPKERVDVERMAVVVGVYPDAGRWPKLPFAEREGAALVERYGARELPASEDDLDRLFEARMADGGGAEAVHFACHGTADAANPQYASLILAPSGRPLSYLAVGAEALGEKHAPFVFLNACQVGAAGELFDSYAGFAGSFLRAGARAFLAPLWSVNDEVAMNLALDLYRAAAERPVAEILRDARGRARIEPGEVPESTYLAYVFYGHPRLRLNLPSPEARP
jgi:CHAT domain/Ternary complex associated domain 7